MQNLKKDRIKISLQSSPTVGFLIEVMDAALLGKEASFEIEKHINVSDSRAVNRSEVVFKKRLTLSQQNLIDVSSESIRAYSYAGSMIDIEVRSKLKIDDGILFDTTISEKQQMALKAKPLVANDAESMINPHDDFNFLANLQAIPASNRMKVRIMLMVAALLIGSNSYVGWHDQFVPEGAHYFYSHYDSDGDAESPFMKSLGLSGGVGVCFWFLIRRELKKYMTFIFKPLPATISRATAMRVADIITGVPRVDLENIVVRIAACNMECGQYKRGSGTKERTVSFKEPVRAVLLFEKSIPKVASGFPIESYLEDRISFKEMFAVLYPPNMISDSHGIKVHWEVQLLHEEFIDQELVGDTSLFEYKDFLEA